MTKGNSIGKKKLPENIERDKRSNMEMDHSKAEILFEVRWTDNYCASEWIVEKHGQHAQPICGC